MTGILHQKKTGKLSESLNVRGVCLISAIFVLCSVTAKCEAFTTTDTELFIKSNSKSTSSDRTLHASLVTEKSDSNANDDDKMTADDMLLYGIGAAPAFEDSSNEGFGTTKALSTSESSLAGLASIAGGFDHASFEPHEYSDASNTPSTPKHGSTNAQNSSNNYPTSPFKQYINQRIKCGHLTITKDNKRLYTIKVAKPCRFWAEGVISTVVAIFGFVGNLISIWVLADEELRRSAFNRLLLALAIIDCMFIMPGTIIYTAKAFAWEADWYNRTFPVFIYPFTEISLCSSIYMTVAIAVERYIGLCRPFQRLSGSCSAKTYITPVVLVAMILNIPKFFESETTYRTSKGDNTTITSIGVTSLRLHPDYITYYWMWTRLLTTGVIPFLVLALLNSKIYLAIRKSKHELRALAIR